MANRESRNKDYESLATMGTGGSSKLEFLVAIDTQLSWICKASLFDRVTVFITFQN
jgi:hypothetical protein